MSFYSGFYNFNNDEGLNFQLNRFYCSGFLTYDELMDIGRKITGLYHSNSLDDTPSYFILLLQLADRF